MTARDHAIIWRELYFYFQTDTDMAKLYYNSCTNTPFNYATVYLEESKRARLILSPKLRA